MTHSLETHLLAIHGSPRSGSTWLGQLFNSHEQVAYRYQPFFSHAFRGQIDLGANAQQVAAFFQRLAETEDDFVLQRGAAKLAQSQPSFCKQAMNHLVYKEVRFHHFLPLLMASMPNMKLLALVRDPRDVLASWLAAPREFNPQWDVQEEWYRAPRKNLGLAENWYGFERWKALAQLFLQLQSSYPQRVLLVRYEDLVAQPLAQMEHLLDFAGLRMTDQVRAFIQDSTSRDDGETYGVHRSSKAAQANVILPFDLEEKILSELQGSVLMQFLRDPSFEPCPSRHQHK